MKKKISYTTSTNTSLPSKPASSLGRNSNAVRPVRYMTRYYVSGGNGFNDVMSWSAQSGGPGGVTIPDTFCNVIFDANSPSCTLLNSIHIRSINTEGYTGDFDAAGFIITVDTDANFNFVGDLIFGNELHIGDGTLTIGERMLVISASNLKIFFDGSSTFNSHASLTIKRLIIGTKHVARTLHLYDLEVLEYQSGDWSGTADGRVLWDSLYIIPYTLKAPVGAAISYCDIRNCDASSGDELDAWDGTNTDLGGNTSIAFGSSSSCSCSSSSCSSSSFSESSSCSSCSSSESTSSSSSSSTVASQILYFIGAVPGNWSSGSNWSLASGGGAYGYAPTSVDTARLDANSPQCTLDVAANCGILDTTGYASSLIFAGYTLTVEAGVIHAIVGLLDMSTVGSRLIVNNSISGASSFLGAITPGTDSEIYLKRTTSCESGTAKCHDLRLPESGYTLTLSLNNQLPCPEGSLIIGDGTLALQNRTQLCDGNIVQFGSGNITQTTYLGGIMLSGTVSRTQPAVNLLCGIQAATATSRIITQTGNVVCKGLAVAGGSWLTDGYDLSLSGISPLGTWQFHIDTGKTLDLLSPGGRETTLTTTGDVWLHNNSIISNAGASTWKIMGNFTIRSVGNLTIGNYEAVSGAGSITINGYFGDPTKKLIVNTQFKINPGVTVNIGTDLAEIQAGSISFAGASGSDQIYLRAASTKKLTVLEAFPIATYCHALNIDSSGGNIIADVDGTDEGGNTNWIFV